MWPPAGTSASIMVVAEFMPELETRQSSAPSSSRIFSSTTRVVGLPYLQSRPRAQVGGKPCPCPD